MLFDGRLILLHITIDFEFNYCTVFVSATIKESLRNIEVQTSLCSTPSCWKVSFTVSLNGNSRVTISSILDPTGLGTQEEISGLTFHATPGRGAAIAVF